MNNEELKQKIKDIAKNDFRGIQTGLNFDKFINEIAQLIEDESKMNH